MRRTNRTLRGESECVSSLALRIRLNNVIILAAEAKTFARLIAEYYGIPNIRIEYRDRKENRAYSGYSYPQASVIILYRPSIQVFLHELAHMTHFYKHNSLRHNVLYANCLDILIRDAEGLLY